LNLLKIPATSSTPVTGLLQTIRDNLKHLFENKADIDSPSLEGIPTAPTADPNTNNTQLATTAFVRSLIVNNLTTDNAARALSAAQGKALQDSKAPLASPTFSGTPKIGTNPVAVAASNSGQNDTNLPVGSYVLCGHNTVNRNVAVTPRLSNGVNFYDHEYGSGTALSGTWRQCGCTAAGNMLLRRVA